MAIRVGGNRRNNQDVSVYVDVSPGIAASLDAMGKRLSRQVLAEAAKAGASVVALSIASRIPVDTGTLRSTLGIQIDSTPNRTTATVGFTDTLDASIAYWVEHGHNSRQAKTATQKWFKQKGTHLGHVPPHPFFRPGIDSALQASSEAVMSVIAKAVATQDSAASSSSNGPASRDAVTGRFTKAVAA